MVKIVSPYITEAQPPMEVGTIEDILRSTAAFGDAAARYDDQLIMGIGGKTVIVHGDAYLDMFTCPEILRLFDVRQLGMVSNDHIFTGADHKRYSHSLAVALRMEMALRTNSGFAHKPRAAQKLPLNIDHTNTLFQTRQHSVCGFTRGPYKLRDWGHLFIKHSHPV